MQAGAEPEIYGWVCHMYKISKQPHQGKGQGPQPVGGDRSSQRGGVQGASRPEWGTWRGAARQCRSPEQGRCSVLGAVSRNLGLERR